MWAVGTWFDVRKLDDSVEVTVEEGRVLAGAPDVFEQLKGMSARTSPILIVEQTAVANAGGLTVKALAENGISRGLGRQNQMLCTARHQLLGTLQYSPRLVVVSYPDTTRVCPPSKSRYSRYHPGGTTLYLGRPGSCERRSAQARGTPPQVTSGTTSRFLRMDDKWLRAQSVGRLSPDWGHLNVAAWQCRVCSSGCEPRPGNRLPRAGYRALQVSR